jgi:hypothetical protein
VVLLGRQARNSRMAGMDQRSANFNVVVRWIINFTNPGISFFYQLEPL